MARKNKNRNNNRGKAAAKAKAVKSAPKRSAPAPKRSAPAPKRSAPAPRQSAPAPRQSAPAKSQPSPPPKRKQVAAQAAQMSVGDRRKAAAKAGVSVKDYKAGNIGNKAVARNNPGPSGNGGNNAATPGKFTTAAGHEMEKGAYSSGAQGIYDQYEQDSNGKGGGVGSQHIGSFDKGGHLSYDSTKYQVQNNTALKEAGYKAGDMLWKPGQKDDLNGRELTGRIARISASGNYIPEYVDDAINSSHQSTGNAGYQGEVGLGADQGAYNRQYEREYDVEYGQVNQQLENNGYDEEGIDNYWENTNNQRAQIAATRNGASGETSEMAGNGGTNQYGDPEGTNYAGGSPGFYDEGGGGFDSSQQSPSYMPNMRLPGNSAAEAAAGSQSNVWNPGQLFNRSKKMNMDFSFNPGKFMQGQ